MFALVGLSPAMLSLWYIPAGIISGFCLVAFYGAEWMQFWGMTIFGLSAAWLVRMLSVSGGSPLDTVLEWSPLRFLGRISYGIYLWHLPILSLLVFAHLQNRLIVLTILPLSITAALLSYALIELPFLKLKVRRGQGVYAAGSAPRHQANPVEYGLA